MALLTGLGAYSTARLILLPLRHGKNEAFCLLEVERPWLVWGENLPVPACMSGPLVYLVTTGRFQLHARNSTTPQGSEQGILFKLQGECRPLCSSSMWVANFFFVCEHPL